jgi:hypothetical protein
MHCAVDCQEAVWWVLGVLGGVSTSSTQLQHGVVFVEVMVVSEPSCRLGNDRISSRDEVPCGEVRDLNVASCCPIGMRGRALRVVW